MFVLSVLSVAIGVSQSDIIADGAKRSGSLCFKTQEVRVRTRPQKSAMNKHDMSEISGVSSKLKYKTFVLLSWHSSPFRVDLC